MKKLLATIGMVIVLLGAATGAFAAKEAVKIGYLRLVMSLPTFVAQGKGLFSQEGLQVELIPFDSATAIMDALMAGRIDCIGSNGITGFWFAAQSAPQRFKIFLLYGTKSMEEDNSFSVVVKKDSPLKGLKDLKGKKVGTYPGASSVALAKAVIRTQIDPDKVIFTEIPPPNMIQVLAVGQIDAFFAPEPSGMIAIAQWVGRYLRESPLTLLKLRRGIPGAAFAFSAKFLQGSPEQAKRLKSCLDKAVDYIRTNEKEARPYLVKYTGLTETVAMSISFDQWMKLEEFDKRA
ncbi:MAG: ABC transporter substrate-binding protein, partial [Desulfobacterales bacterium]|nr:ABC transporter substrate-binding protein [Desulfobacterales bacterium]